MSLLSLFVGKHLVPALESAFIAHEPEAQQLFLSETTELANHLVTWINSKVKSVPPVLISQAHGSME